MSAMVACQASRTNEIVDDFQASSFRRDMAISANPVGLRTAARRSPSQSGCL